ncbi:hypothetical protein LTR10_012738 [Elasticomyces elasticus]|uniref:Chitin-binding type-1 domain-containing protein n=1 Tax=Exophiala sideris TaxID=1016849 RepID=A0ABR0JR45_9EURO|nr:hypothetical protein LTR10_012738 [Elasticomyces elasticus]KAK5034615.1 hypothetical protein LTR13_006271 [Exophiala sideris]KAK5040063.1 hypothetical protein LTS07_000559 [Exophiala sideris]KAK5068441.1 hypothetical protein LTR69_000560 [Exophiala sideris]KAK5187743.1 hypothetical protein LTR44_000560 [Eurotiomycetes sp. CCFEE 6388]
MAAEASTFVHIKGLHYHDSLLKRQTTFCGTGNTCAEACGAGFEQCGSSPDHCYNPTAGEGQDVSACAVSQAFTLPASTASATSAAATSSNGSAITPAPLPATSTSPASPATYTGLGVMLEPGLAGKVVAAVVGLAGLL